MHRFFMQKKKTDQTSLISLHYLHESQTDLSLCLAHLSEGTFFHVVAQIMMIIIILLILM